MHRHRLHVVQGINHLGLLQVTEKPGSAYVRVQRAHQGDGIDQGHTKR
jgi:hypothetical protein